MREGGWFYLVRGRVKGRGCKGVGGMQGARGGWGGIIGGPQCHKSNLRNGLVDCHYFPNFHVNLKMF